MKTWTDSAKQTYTNAVKHIATRMRVMAQVYGAPDSTLTTIERILNEEDCRRSHYEFRFGLKEIVRIDVSHCTWGSNVDHMLRVDLNHGMTTLTLDETIEIGHMLVGLGMEVRKLRNADEIKLDQNPVDPELQRKANEAEEEARLKQVFQTDVACTKPDERMMILNADKKFVWIPTGRRALLNTAKRLVNKGFASHEGTVRGQGRWFKLTPYGVRVKNALLQPAN